MKPQYDTHTLRIGKITGVLYKRPSKTNTIVILGKGAPSVPDNGGNPIADVAIANGSDVFIPDYIGNGRSEGRFTPMNCVRTFLVLYDGFVKGCTGTDYFNMRKMKLKYGRVIPAGTSFGGRFLPALHRFNNNIKEICILYSAMDVTKYGNLGVHEESHADFNRTMEKAGYRHLYRGIMSKEWERHWFNKDSIAPVNCIRNLKDVDVFMAHGMLDEDINYRRSVEYYNRITGMFPEKKGKTAVLELYKNGTHGPETGKLGLRDFFKWSASMKKNGRRIQYK